MFDLYTSLKHRMKSQMVSPEDALPGRQTPLPIANRHYVLGNPLLPPYPEHLQEIVVGMGCFWGAEKRFWTLPGVYTTAVGYSAGITPNPTYEEVCSGQTGHNEVVKIVFDPSRLSLDALLVQFWESHNPTQGMRQGNDVGTQYRSGLYYATEDQRHAIDKTLQHYQAELKKHGQGTITTEIKPMAAFYYAEDYHQQYLAKNPGGYCGLGGTGVCY